MKRSSFKYLLLFYSNTPLLAQEDVLSEDLFVTEEIKIEEILEPPAEYHYAAFGKPDPFVPPAQKFEEVVDADALEIPIVSPLQKFKLDQLQVVGIWQDTFGEKKALILTASSNGSSGRAQRDGIVVKLQDPIGSQGGIVVAIESDHVMVREFYLNKDGTRQFEDVKMELGVSKEPDPDRILFTPGKTESSLLFPMKLNQDMRVISGVDPTQKPSQKDAGSETGQNGAKEGSTSDSDPSAISKAPQNGKNESALGKPQALSPPVGKPLFTTSSGSVSEKTPGAPSSAAPSSSAPAASSPTSPSQSGASSPPPTAPSFVPGGANIPGTPNIPGYDPIAPKGDK